MSAQIRYRFHLLKINACTIPFQMLNQASLWIHSCRLKTDSRVTLKELLALHSLMLWMYSFPLVQMLRLVFDMSCCAYLESVPVLETRIIVFFFPPSEPQNDLFWRLGLMLLLMIGFPVFVLRKGMTRILMIITN